MGRPRSSLTIAGIPFHIAPSWLVVAAFMTWSLATGYFPSQYPWFSVPAYWGMGLAASLLLFGCILLHELGHALVARRCGITVLDMTLFLFGGVARLAADPRRPAIELLVALAGPLVSAALAGLCWLAGAWVHVDSRASLIAVAILRYLAMINIGLILFNLLPGFPLDGGRILRAAVWGWTGNLRAATRVASAIGSALGLGLIGLGIWVMVRGAGLHGLWYVLLGMFLRNAAQASFRHNR